MNIYLILGIIFMILAIMTLLYFNSITKLKKYKEKMIKAENIIDESINKKLDLIIAINGEVKKVTGKKDYLKDYVSIRDLIITNIEKDIKLEEAVKLLNDLMQDYNELNKAENFKNIYNEIKKVDELLISAKNMFNQNAIISNQIIKTFPNNIVAKIAGFKYRSFYSSKTDSEETF